MSVKDTLEMAKRNKAEIVDLKFVDFPGLWQHFSIPATKLSAEIFEPYTRDPRYSGKGMRQSQPSAFVTQHHLVQD